MSDPFTISRRQISQRQISQRKVVLPPRHRLIDLSLLLAVAGLFVWALLL
jgi:hypothetical protein